MINKQTLEMWHTLSFNNKLKIQLCEPNNKGSCFHCCEIFPLSEITEFTSQRRDEKGTAICPKCGIDSVIPMEIDVIDLKEMSHYYFNSNEEIKKNQII